MSAGPTFVSVVVATAAVVVVSAASASSLGPRAPLGLAGDAHVVVEGELVAVEHGGPREAVSGHGALAAGLHLGIVFDLTT